MQALGDGTVNPNHRVLNEEADMSVTAHPPQTSPLTEEDKRILAKLRK